MSFLLVKDEFKTEDAFSKLIFFFKSRSSRFLTKCWHFAKMTSICLLKSTYAIPFSAHDLLTFFANNEKNAFLESSSLLSLRDIAISSSHDSLLLSLMLIKRKNWIFTYLTWRLNIFTSEHLTPGIVKKVCLCMYINSNHFYYICAVSLSHMVFVNSNIDVSKIDIFVQLGIFC